MANLAVDTESFHYKYYCWIRKIWGCDEPKGRTSLCPYCQTMLWGSIFCILLSPALVFGWLAMKAGRIVTKIDHPLFDKFFDWYGSKFEWMDRLEKGPDNFSESPMAAGIVYTVFGITTAFCILAAVIVTGIILALLGKGIWNIGALISAVIYGVAHIGWAFTFVAYWMGWAFVTAWEYIVWFFTNGPMWWTIGTWIVYIFGSIIGLGVASVLLCLIAREISKLQIAKTFGTYLLNKFNGFPEARAARAQRLKEIKEKAKKSLPPWTCEWCHYDNNEGSAEWCLECRRDKPQPPVQEPLGFIILTTVLTPILWPLSKCMTGYEKIKNKEINIMGPFGIIWEYILAIKKGVCPMVEFVDIESIRSQQQAAAAERMAAEQKIQESEESKDA